MTVTQTIAKNTLFLMVAKLVGMVLGFFYVMYVARYLGAEKYGILSFALSFAAISSIFLNLGFGILTTREVSRNKELGGKFIGNFVLIKLILSLIVFASVAGAVKFLNYPEQTSRIIYLIFFSAIIGSYSSLFQSIFQAFQKMEYISIGQILNNIMMFFGALLLISNDFDITGFALLYLIVSLIIFGYNYIFSTWKFVTPTYAINLNFCKNIVKDALPFCLTIIISVLFFHIDILMLTEIKGNEATGLYNSACVIIISIISLAEVFVYAIFPVASKYFISSQNSLEFLLEKSSKYLCIAAFPSSVGIILLAPKIILLIYGAEFAEAAIVLQVLGLYLPLRFISHSTGWTLAAINKEPLRTVSAGLSICLNIILNIILIPKLGMVGAGIATVISQIILFSLYFYFTARFFYKLPLHKIMVKPLISSLVMGMFILLFNDLNLFIIIILSGILYLLVLHFIKGFDFEDKRIFREIMSAFPI